MATSKSAKEVDRDKALHGLPERLHRDEELIRSQDDRLNAVVVELETLTADIEQLRQAAPTPASTLFEDTASRVTDLAAELLKTKEKVEGLASSVTAMKEGHRHLIDEQKLVPLLEGLERLTAESDDNERRHLETATVFETISGRLDELESLFLQLPQAKADLSTDKVAESDYVSQTPVAPPHGVLSSPPLLLETIEFPAAVAQNVAEQSLRPAALLEQNLSAIGLKTSSAERLATEVFAAISSCCLVSFKGAFATLAARACAIALAGSQSFRLAVPIGVLNASELSRTINPAVPLESDQVAALVLEGLNNVPVEAIADILFDLSTGSAGRELLIFASLGDGASALPECSHLLDLGPIFDLDVLDWKLTPPVAAPMVSCRMGRMSLRPVVDASADLEDFLALLRKYGRRNPRRERRAVSHYKNLVAMSSEAGAALKSAAYGWLLPLWAIVGVPKEEMDHSLNSGNCDAATPDERLLRLLGGYGSEKVDKSA
ncbi:hypothetical protein [Devosia ginsengisoli]|uniref:Uncharacterized protein n=1 Tax=Devosia ginsengisoli TaxID=400770 RepID=A0A5B8LU61_9HYPH|nr:hypothetical protein [Devosia ginsengisoli]QDZ11827.1 hypothetical protein FPZ08_14405 [Devosia ginsengisoli]